jgi:uncharacterized protein YndB with AHSA1/START domain
VTDGSDRTGRAGAVTTRAFEFRLGGQWDFVMHGPDGTDYQEWISWTQTLSSPAAYVTEIVRKAVEG